MEKLFYYDYFPKAIETARLLRESGFGQRYVWTTGSYLVYQFLEQASSPDRKKMETAIEDGVIAWHALPFTMHCELMNKRLFRYGLSLSKRLDERFGKKTIAAKLTDPVCHTRAIVPLLAEAGVKLLHIGGNRASCVPEVPGTFVWRHTDGSEIIVIYCKMGYGGTSVYEGIDTVLSFAHTNDNVSGHSVEGVKDLYAQLRSVFKNAEITAGRMDDFVPELIKIKHTLPVVADEMGDSWIYSTATDPKKSAGFRELVRLSDKWAEQGRLIERSDEYEGFYRNMLCIPEHTWGAARYKLDDYMLYTREQLAQLRQTEKCKFVEQTWQEQRDYLAGAVNALGDLPVRREAEAAMAALEPHQPSFQGYQKLERLGDYQQTAFFDVRWSPADGSLISVIDRRSGIEHAGANNALGLFTYEIFSRQDIERYAGQYLRNIDITKDWSIPTFTRPGMDPENKLASCAWTPQSVELYKKEGDGDVSFIASCQMACKPVNEYGCPARIIIETMFPANEPAVEFTLQWFDKKACRMPEGLWFSFAPRVKDTAGWLMDKIGEVFSPYEVVHNASRQFHSVQTGLRYNGEDKRISIETLDAHVVSPGGMPLMDFNNKQPELEKGWHFNLFNNHLNTNFRLWYEEDAKFKFVFRIK